MGSEKKEMGTKNAPGAPSPPNSTSASLLTGVFDVDGRATGHVTRPLFLRINAHSGTIACTDPLRRVGHGDVTPQYCSHFVGAGKVQRFWRGLQDPKAREEHTKIPRPLRPEHLNNPAKHHINNKRAPTSLSQYLVKKHHRFKHVASCKRTDIDRMQRRNPPIPKHSTSHQNPAHGQKSAATTTCPQIGIRTAKKTAADRDSAGDILRQAKLQAAQEILLENPCRALLLTVTSHLQGLLFSPYAPTAPDSDESHGNSDSSDMSEDEKIPTEGKAGAAAKPPL
jgi:hypothetical protein